MSRWSAGRLRGLVSAVVVVVAATVVAVVAFTSRGYPVSDVTYNDGGVWVTDRADGLIGRFNRPIEQLDAALSPSSATQDDFDVLQNAGTVLVWDRAAAQLHGVDVGTVALRDGVAAIPGGYEVVLGGSTVAVLDPASGRLWVRPAAEVTGLDVARDPVTADVGGHADVTVAQDGTVFAASADKATLTTVPAPDGVPGRADTVPLGTTVHTVRVTAVGDHPVVLADGGRVLVAGRTVTLPGDPAGAVSQQPGPDAGSALVATDSGLYGVPLDGGRPDVLSTVGTGTPASPVRLDGCVHAAWAGRPVYLRQCGSARAQTRELPAAPPGNALTFRVNRHVIVLNELAGGGLFLFDRPGDDLGDWNDVKPQRKPDQPPDKLQPATLDKTQQNHPPVARPDSYGVRAGQATVLPVLENDGDLDGDVLVVRSVTGIPAAFGTLAVIRDGQAVQLTATPAATGTVSFTYKIDDGRGGSDQAQVTLTVHPPTQNSPPTQTGRPPALTVMPGGSITYDVLDDWRDPDGDPLVLAGATAPGGDSVQYTPDGRLTFTATGPRAGGRSVPVTVSVSDGSPTPATGKLTVSVLAANGKPAPIARDDLVSALVGQTVAISPMANDTDPEAGAPDSPGPMRLTNVSPAQAGTTVTPDYVGGTIAFTARAAQTYYLTYQVTSTSNAGSANAQARIRIDVRAPTSDSQPVAVTDTAVLRGTAPVQVDVLANDIDADGDVLVVRDVSGPAADPVSGAATAGVSGSVVDHRWVRVVASTDHLRPTALRYTVSDGVHEATGVIEVTQLPSGQDQAPIPRDDVATVRAGDVLGVDVLANDTDPDGDPLTLDPVVVPADSGQGHWFVDGRQVRYQAPAKAGTATAIYTVRDPTGRPAAAKITVNVVAVDAKSDSPPAPPPVTARALAGSVTRIRIPLGGADPDGDSVALLGPTDSPQRGRIVATGPDYIDYLAYDGAAGTDSFDYAVRDPFGKQGTGQVRVGVVARPAVDSPPLAVDDTYVVSPGATLRIPILDNDSDPDGDPVRLEPLSTVDQRTGARLNGNRLLLTAGAHDGDVVTLQYAIDDGRGERAVATVSVTSRTGADLAPVARDDLVTAFPAGAAAVEADVLANDEDIDGSAADLTLAPVDTAGPDAATVTPDRKLRVPLTATDREVAYRITDRQGRPATAFVRVPAAGNQAPQPVAREELQITSGQNATVDITRYATDPDGSPIRLTAADRISTSPTTGLAVVPGSLTRTGLTLHASAGFHGPAMLAFEVTDGATPDAPGAHTSTIVVLVQVVPTGATPPRFTCSAISPQAGARALTLDLSACVTDVAPADREQLSFSAPRVRLAGVTAQQSGGVLTVSAGAEAPTGVPGTITFTVSAGRSAAVPVSLAVTVRPAPLTRANDDVVSGVRAGATVRVAVTANDVNPFPDRPLRVTAATVLTGQVTASVDGDGQHVDITVAANFHGTASVAYQVQDGTGRADRVVEGRVLLAVLDRPAAPAAPVLRSVGNGTAVLSWPEPPANGSPIEGYEVDGGGFAQACPGVVCTLNGLRNGQTYTFTVKARNAVGWSDPSPPSGPVQPDVRPDQPAAPTTVFGDGQITVSWTAPANQGSAIQSYDVDVAPEAGGPRVGVTGTSLVWTGLTNGASYSFRVRAHNSSPTPSDWSPFSAPEIPAGVPARPDAPVAVPVNDGIGQQMTVSWTAPATNGAPISGYSLGVLRGGAPVQTLSVAGDATGATVDVVNGASYTFTLTATNKAGQSPVSAPSAAAVAHGKPAQITGFSVSDHDAGNAGYDQRVAYTITPPDDNGMAIGHYDVSLDGGGSWSSLGGATNGFVGGLSNGASYQLEFRACNDQCGIGSAPSATVVPYGRPFPPGVSATQNGAQQINLTWTLPGSNGRNPSYFLINIDGGGWVSYGLANSRTVTVGNGYNQTHTLQAELVDTAGQTSAVATASATTQSPPPAVMTVSKGARFNNAGCVSSSCARVHLRMTGFAPNTSYTVGCDSDATGPPFPNFTARTDGSGTWEADTIEYFGYPGNHVWCFTSGVESNHYQWPP